MKEWKWVQAHCLGKKLPQHVDVISCNFNEGMSDPGLYEALEEFLCMGLNGLWRHQTLTEEGRTCPAFSRVGIIATTWGRSWGCQWPPHKIHIISKWKTNPLVWLFSTHHCSMIQKKSHLLLQGFWTKSLRKKTPNLVFCESKGISVLQLAYQNKTCFPLPLSQTLHPLIYCISSWNLAGKKQWCYE